MHWGVLLIFFVLFFDGLAIFIRLYKTQNKFLTLGGGMILGPLGYLFILSIFSYVLKGSFFIFLLFLIYTIICLKLFYSLRSYYGLLFRLKVSFQNFIFLLALLLYLYLILLFVPVAAGQIGTDFYIYSGIASSFSRGNYPTVLPWQPQFLTIYHSGTFLLEGAIKAIFDVGYYQLQELFSGYLLVAILLFLVGLAREYTKSVLCLLPSLGLILFGGPPLLIKGELSYLQNLLNLTNLSKHPQFSDLSHVLGGGASEPSGLVHFIFYTFGLSIFFFFLYCLLQNNHSNRLTKYILLTTLMCLSLAVDETFFLIELPIVAFIFVIENIKTGFRSFLNKSLLIFALFLVMFTLLQNPIRDSIIIPSPKEIPRFTIFYPYFTDIPYPLYSEAKNNIPNVYRVFSEKDKLKLAFNEVIGRWGSRANGQMVQNGETHWYFPGFFEIGLFILILCLITRSRLGLVISISSILSFIYALVLTNIFFGSNYIRFFNQGYNLIIFALGFLIIELLSKKKNKRFLILGALLLLLLIPSIITSHARIIKSISTADKVNSLIHLSTYEYYRDFFQRISNLIPFNKRIIFLDGFPFDNTFPPINLEATTEFGLFIPMGPKNYKIHNPDDSGIEFYDAMSNLSPYALKDLQIDYIYLFRDKLKYYPKQKIDELNNPNYFKPIYADNIGILYNVQNDYKNISSASVDLKSLTEIIPTGSTVYIGKFSTEAIARALLLELSKRTNLIGIHYTTGGGHPIYVETFLPYFPVCPPIDKTCISLLPPISRIKSIDYIILDPKEEPNTIWEGDYKELARIPHLVLWGNVLK